MLFPGASPGANEKVNGYCQEDDSQCKGSLRSRQGFQSQKRAKEYQQREHGGENDKLGHRINALVYESIRDRLTRPRIIDSECRPRPGRAPNPPGCMRQSSTNHP